MMITISFHRVSMRFKCNYVQVKYLAPPMAQGECSKTAIIYLLTHIIRKLNTYLGDTGGDEGNFVTLEFGERAKGLRRQGYAHV